MVIILLGYMASGKSTIGKVLAEKLNYTFIDLDDFIEAKEQMTIPNIFVSKGEIHFRKIETLYLNEILNSYSNAILSLGGGTPCYSNNMSDILKDQNATSIYLKASLNELVNRLEKEKQQRPLVAHLKTKKDMLEFVSKHLFERSNFYNQAEIVVNTDGKSEKEIIEDIVLELF